MTNADPAAIEALRASLERRFRTATTTVQVLGEALSLCHPANADELISEEDYVRDERLPYWADVWPSSVVLAEHVRRAEGASRRLLELGCGIGLVAASAARAGFDVTATDYYDDALEFARLNVATNAGREIRARLVDWRNLPDDLGTFNVVVASDVLYEPRYGPHARGMVLAMIPIHLRHGLIAPHLPDGVFHLHPPTGKRPVVLDIRRWPLLPAWLPARRPGH